MTTKRGNRASWLRKISFTVLLGLAMSLAQAQSSPGEEASGEVPAANKDCLKPYIAEVDAVVKQYEAIQNEIGDGVERWRSGAKGSCEVYLAGVQRAQLLAAKVYELRDKIPQCPFAVMYKDLLDQMSTGLTEDQVLTACPPSDAASWGMSETDETGDLFFIAPTPIDATGPYPGLWSKTVYAQPLEDGSRAEVFLLRLDCTRRFGITQFIIRFTDPDATKVGGILLGPSDRFPIVDDTFFADFCAGRAGATPAR